MIRRPRARLSRAFRIVGRLADSVTATQQMLAISQGILQDVKAASSWFIPTSSIRRRARASAPPLPTFLLDRAANVADRKVIP